MNVGQLIKVLEQLDPELDILYVQNSGITAPIKSVQEISYRGFHPDRFVGLCCGKKIEQGIVNDMYAAPVYISQESTRKKQPL